MSGAFVGLAAVAIGLATAAEGHVPRPYSPPATGHRQLVNDDSAALHRYEAVEPHMGTLVRITLHAPAEAAARAAFAAAFARIRELDETLSDYQPASELNRVTAAAAGAEIRGSRDLIRVLAAAQDLALATGGAFDITQGPVIRLWREARASGRLPDTESLRLASARSGFPKLHVDRGAGTVRLDESGMRLDVGAIGKGYAASEALAVLTARGIGSALVAVSGDLAFSGAPPGSRGWRIDMPSAGPASGIPSILELTDAAVSSSGASEQHLDVGGRRYSHVIDPATGTGLTGDITVAVVAPHGLDADGLDTAVSVLGVEKGLALIESRPETAALIVHSTPEGPRLVPSTRFRALAAAQRRLN
jgi:thiamine biosynthesis lipoprotein